MHLCTSLVAAAVLACALNARADTFTLTGPGVDDIFTLPDSPTVSSYGTYGFTLRSIPVTESGTQVTDQILFFNQADGGGLLLEDPSNDDLNPFGAVLYTNTASHPTFKTGSFALDALSETYYITIGEIAVTPEPSSILLLSTGLLVTSFSMRRPSTSHAVTSSSTG